MEKKDRHIRYYLFAGLSYVLFFLALFFFMKNRIISNFERGGYREEAVEYMISKTEKKDIAFPVTFWSINGPETTKRAIAEDFSDDLHLLLEALLLGPSQKDTEKGLITYIPEGTSLIGATLKDGMCFINLSKEFLSSINLDRAVLQIKNTLTSLDENLRVSVMVEGEAIS